VGETELLAPFVERGTGLKHIIPPPNGKSSDGKFEQNPAPREGGALPEAGELPGGTKATLTAPGDHDWLAVIRR
jgi:hypothetical protein